MLRYLRTDEIVGPEQFNLLLRALRELRQPNDLRDARSTWPRELTAASPLVIRRQAGRMQLALTPPDDEMHFELLETLEPGGDAAVKVLEFDGEFWQPAATGTRQVHDAIGSIRGEPGSRGLARFHRQSGRWIVWQLQCE